MNRKYDRLFIYQLIDKIRAKIPGITIRTTLMVGFPGETETQFNELLDFVQRVKFDRLGVFTYSNEEGTLSFRLPHQIPEEIKEKRRQIIMSVQAEISREKNQKLVGTVQKVLIEKKEKTKWSGRTAAQAPEVDGITYVSSDYDLKIGEFYNTLITETGIYDLKGIVLDSLGEFKIKSFL
jgi:ribosomal protein S12 methylthiotransferase